MSEQRFEYLVEIHVVVRAVNGTEAEGVVQQTLRGLWRRRPVVSAFVADVRSEDDPDPVYREAAEL